MERFVERGGGRERGQLAESALGASQLDLRRQPIAAGVGLVPFDPYHQRVAFPRGKVGQRGALPKSERVVQESCRALHVSGGERGRALRHEALEAEEVDLVGVGGEPIPAWDGYHRVRPERPPQPSHQGLHRRDLVGGRRIPFAPHL